MLNGSEYSLADLREELAFYKGSTVLATFTCIILLSILFYVCTHKPEREEIYTVQHGMDSSHGTDGGTRRSVLCIEGLKLESSS